MHMMTNAHWNSPPPDLDANALAFGISDIDVTSAARTSACVLLTGKPDAVRTVARRIHELSSWRTGPMTVVRCGWPDPIVEFLLFGAFTEKEATTAEGRQPAGAQQGTVLLQDVWRLSPAFQDRLAEQLARSSETRGSRPWRLMATTSEPLLPRVIEGTFSDLLYYRLNVIHLVV